MSGTGYLSLMKEAKGDTSFLSSKKTGGFMKGSPVHRHFGEGFQYFFRDTYKGREPYRFVNAV